MEESGMDDREKKVFCPILGRELDVPDCYDAAMVYEEMSPLSKLRRNLLS
jgi:hypothetical protein